MIESRTLQPGPFRRYLQLQPADSIVGLVEDGWRNSLAQYLRASGYPGAEVRPRVYLEDRTGSADAGLLPRWAVLYLVHTQDLARGTVLTAGDALACLEKALEEIEHDQPGFPLRETLAGAVAGFAAGIVLLALDGFGARDVLVTLTAGWVGGRWS